MKGGSWVGVGGWDVDGGVTVRGRKTHSWVGGAGWDQLRLEKKGEKGIRRKAVGVRGGDVL